MSCIYSTSGRCIDKVISRKGTPKSVVFAEKGLKQTKLVYKLVVETLKFRSVLEDLLKKTSLEKDERWIGKGRLLCLTYEFIIGTGIKNKKFKKVFEKYKSQLKNGFTILKVKRKAQTANDLLPEEVRTLLPKYARVNTLLSNVHEVKSALCEKFEVLQSSSADFVKDCKAIKENQAICDPILDGIFAFHASINLAELELNKKNKLIIQDRASCLPPFVLAPMDGDIVLDCCAAPGNKTQQLSQYVGHNGTVIACEMDPKRYRLLDQRMKSLGCNKIVDCKLQNFLNIDVNTTPWSKVTKIMLDPSCSGSGMAHRRMLQETDSDERVEKLALFQEDALRKAMSFPNVQRITYSTCSTHTRENDVVVQNVLKEEKDWMVSNANETIDGFSEKSVSGTITVAPFTSGTNGFFVALLTRNT